MADMADSIFRWNDNGDSKINCVNAKQKTPDS